MAKFERIGGGVFFIGKKGYNEGDVVKSTLALSERYPDSWKLLKASKEKEPEEEPKDKEKKTTVRRK